MSEKLRLLLVTKSTGGVAEYVRRLTAADGLDRALFDITVACLSENGPQFAAELAKQPGVKTFALAMNRYKVDPFGDARVLLALRSHIRAEQYDLAHAHASKPGFLARLAAAGTCVPVLYSPHCFAFHDGAGRLSASVVAMLERVAARFFTARIVAIADGEKTLARRWNVGTDGLFVTVHTGIDPRPYRQATDVTVTRTSLGVPANAPLVGSVGRLIAQKAPLDFVRAAAVVHRTRPDVHFVWAGAGPLEQQARALAQALGLGESMHFCGQRADIPAVLQALQVFALTSRWEGFPLVVLEAMAAGAPVVATDIPGSDEAIRAGRDGLLTRPGDPDDMAKAVLRILDDPALAAKFRLSASERIDSEFTPRAMLDGLSAIYQQTARENGARSIKPARLAGKESL